MNKLSHKILCCLLSIVGMVNASSLVFASGSTKAPRTLVLKKELLKLNQTDTNNFVRFADSLASKLKTSSVVERENIIKNAYSNDKNTVTAKVQDLIRGNSVKKTVLNSKELIDSGFEKSYVLNGTETVTITPTYVIIDKLNVSKNDIISTFARSQTKSISGSTTKTAYGLLGNKLFDITVTCGFNYNGKSAWYKSGFDYSYTRGFLSIWQVANWKGWKEQSGTDYVANCSGNFHFGLEYNGIGLIVQDFYCKNSLTCSKDGVLTRSTNW